MGVFDNVPVLSGVEDAAGTVATGAADVPADAVNAATGTGENLGFFGRVDRALDPRNISEDDVADAGPGTTGVSGFIRGTFGAVGGGAGQAAGAAANAARGSILSSPFVLGIALLVAIVALGTLFDFQVGGES